jgi:hypothetical protein
MRVFRKIVGSPAAVIDGWATAANMTEFSLAVVR